MGLERAEDKNTQWEAVQATHVEAHQPRPVRGGHTVLGFRLYMPAYHDYTEGQGSQNEVSVALGRQWAVSGFSS